MPGPGRFDGWTVYEGSVFGGTLTWPGIATAVGYSAEMQIRAAESRSSAEILTLSTTNGRLALSSNGTDLTVTLRITAPDTVGWTVLPGTDGLPRAHYDIKITPPSGADDTWCALQGTIGYDRDTTAVPV